MSGGGPGQGTGQCKGGAGAPLGCQLTRTCSLAHLACLACMPGLLSVPCRAHLAEGPEAVQRLQAQGLHPLLKQPAGRWVWGLWGAKLGDAMLAAAPAVCL